jgi:hypothetical protein
MVRRQVALNQPLLSSSSLDLVDVLEGLFGFQVKSLVLVDNNCIHQLNCLLVDVGDIEAEVTDQPLLSCLALDPFGIFALPDGFYFQGLSRGNNVGLHHLQLFNMDVRDIDLGSVLQPLVSCYSFHSIFVFKVPDAFEF